MLSSVAFAFGAGAPTRIFSQQSNVISIPFTRTRRPCLDWQLYQRPDSSFSEVTDTCSVDNSTIQIASDENTRIIGQENATVLQPHRNDHHPQDAGSLVWFESDLLEMPPESVLWLNAVAVVWGSQHPVIKMVVEDCDASAFSLARFGLAALLASPYTPGLYTGENEVGVNGDQEEQSNQNTNVSTAWRWGAEMGVWMFLGYAFQAIGLEHTTAQRSGFLLYLNVKFVPFFARVLFGRQISIPTWISALTALLGTALLAGGNLQDLNIGDAWSVAAAAASAMFILRLESASEAVPDSAQLNAACLWVVTALALVWSLVQSGLLLAGVTPDVAWQETCTNVVDTATRHPWELVYLGGVTTALANYMQTRAQKGVRAERASVIYAMDPVYGAGFSNLLLGEQLRGWGIVGAGLITLAAATNAFLDFQTEPSNEDKRSQE